MKNNLSEYLSAKPVVRTEIVWSAQNGNIILYFENKGVFNRILQAVINKPKISQIHLDEKGSYIWKMLDGNNSVYDIATELENKFEDSVKPLYERLIKYLNILKHCNLIYLKR